MKICSLITFIFLTVCPFYAGAVQGGHNININAWDSLSNQVIINGNGTIIIYFPNGSKKYIESYKNNKLHGEKIIWYQNGKIYFKAKYDHGKQIGEDEYYYEDGIKWEKGDDPTNPMPSPPH